MLADILIPSQETFGVKQEGYGVKDEEVFGVKRNCSFSHLLQATSGGKNFSARESEDSLTSLGLNFITAEELDEQLSFDFQTSYLSSGSTFYYRSNTLLLIDLRSIFQHQESHIRESTNLSNCALLSKRIRTGKLQLKEYLGARVSFDGTQNVVIYEQSRGHGEKETEGAKGVTDFAKLIFNNLKRVSTGGANVQILRGGFDLFRQKYPQHCTQGVKIKNSVPLATNLNNDEMAFLNWEASKIRENFYLGALHDAEDDKLLAKLGITHILNCCKTNSRKNDSNDGKYRYLQLMYDDNLRQSLNEKLATAFEFIDSAMQEATAKVLIHCYAGISRSTAVTIAYMMHRMGMSYEESYRELKQKRSIVAPNINFVSQLLKYDEERNSLNKEK